MKTITHISHCTENGMTSVKWTDTYGDEYKSTFPLVSGERSQEATDCIDRLYNRLTDEGRANMGMMPVVA